MLLPCRPLFPLASPTLSSLPIKYQPVDPTYLPTNECSGVNPFSDIDGEPECGSSVIKSLAQIQRPSVAEFRPAGKKQQSGD